MLSKTLLRTALACLLLVISVSQASAAIIAGYDSGRHDRFLGNGDPNPGFLLQETNLSGVAIRRAVLITPRHYVTAAHVSTTTVTFRGSDGIRRTYQSEDSTVMLTDDGSGGMVESDIRVHRLSEEVHSSIEPLPVVVGDFESLIGQTIIAMDQNQRAGRNVVDGVQVIEFSSGTRDTLTMRYSYDTAENGGVGGLGIDEVGLLSGDSGDAALIEINGQLGVLGAHMGISVPDGSSAAAGDRYDSFSTLIGAYEDQLNNFVSADGYQFQTLEISAIPEATSVTLFALAGATLMQRRRRSIRH